MTPEDYYKQEFPDDYNLIKDMKLANLFSFDTVIKFAELYANSQTKL